MEKQDSVQRFLELIRRSHRGKFKVYIGMSAGVGKTYRMLQEARQLLDAGVDVSIGYIETHGRTETEALKHFSVLQRQINFVFLHMLPSL